MKNPTQYIILLAILTLSLTAEAQTKPIKGHVTAYKPGHFSNTAFARKIKQSMLQQQDQ